MCMGYNTMNVMRMGIDSVAPARMQGFYRLFVYRGFAALHRLPVVWRP